MKKWLNWVALVVIFSIACGFLANWQFTRRESKLAAIKLVNDNFGKNPVPIADLVNAGDFDVPSDNWRSVIVKGHYLQAGSLLVRNRPNDGQPGFEQLVPFVTKGFNIIFVSRGWLPTGDRQDKPDSIPVVSETDTTLIAKVMSAEPELARGAPVGQIASINIGLADRATGLKSSFQKSYLRLVSEEPSASSALKPMPKPSIEEGNNLSYAIQWILFAIMAVMALVWRIRKDRELSQGKLKKSRSARNSELDALFEDSITTEK